MTEDAIKLECRGCGSGLEYSATHQTARCPYCGTVTEIPRTEEELPDSPTALLPLAVELKSLTDAVHEHLASGDYTPDQLLEHATFTKKERFYAPAYGYRGNFVAKWTASFGYDRREEYTVYEKRHENGKSHSVPVTRTRIVTDWRPASGTDTGDIAVLAYAGKQLLGTTANAVSLVENRSATESVSFDPSYTTGIPQEPYATSDDDAYHDRAESQVNKIIDHSVHQHAQGDRQKDWHWTANINKNAFTILIPICHAVYEYQGTPYNVWVSGTDASRLVADKLPVDVTRQNSVIYGFLPLAVSAIASAIAVFALGYRADVPAYAILAAMLYGALRRSAIIKHSKDVRQFLLANRRAAASNTAGMTSAEQEALVRETVRPDKPWLAHTIYDHMVIPLVILIVALIPFSQSLMSSDASTQTQNQTQQSSATVASSVPSETTTQVPSSDSNPSTEGQGSQSQISPTTGQAISSKTQPLLARLQSNPNDVAALIGLGNVYYDASQWKDAIGYYTRALNETPRNPDVRTDMGNAYFQSGDADRALKEYDQALTDDPRHVETLLNVGLVKKSQNDPKGAIAAFERLLKIDPTNKNRAILKKWIRQAGEGISPVGSFQGDKGTTQRAPVKPRLSPAAALQAAKNSTVPRLIYKYACQVPRTAPEYKEAARIIADNTTNLAKLSEGFLEAIEAKCMEVSQGKASPEEIERIQPTPDGKGYVVISRTRAGNN